MKAAIPKAFVCKVTHLSNQNQSQSKLELLRMVLIHLTQHKEHGMCRCKDVGNLTGKVESGCLRSHVYQDAINRL